MGHMVCFLSVVSLTAQSAWVFDPWAARAEKTRLKEQLSLLEAITQQYGALDESAPAEIEQAKRYGRTLARRQHRLLSNVSVDAVTKKFQEALLFMPWLEQRRAVREARFRHLLNDSSCNMRLKIMSPTQAHEVLVLGEAVLKLLDKQAILPNTIRRKIHTLVCADFLGQEAQAVVTQLNALCCNEIAQQQHVAWTLGCKEWQLINALFQSKQSNEVFAGMGV